MGADIHLYVEYDDGNNEPFSIVDDIRGYSSGDFLIPRDYHLFAVLAGVRSYDKITPRYEPRGIPEIASPDIINAYYINILDDENERLEEADVSREQAEEWLSSGLSHIRDSWIKKIGFVSNPEYHTPSWLYRDEIIKSFDDTYYKLQDMPYEFQVIVELLESLERYFGKNRVRVVFWFDN
jgi:hypothetical protein